VKLLSYILACYLLLLSVVPCCVFDDCPDDKIEQSSNHENGDDDCGNCSPFFSCEGCAAATIFYQPVEFDFSSQLVLSVHTNYLQAPLSQIEYDFWQPPKVG
jgi:hypothetical protein